MAMADGHNNTEEDMEDGEALFPADIITLCGWWLINIATLLGQLRSLCLVDIFLGLSLIFFCDV